MKNKTYDFLKLVCLVVVPPLVVLLTTLEDIWAFNIPMSSIVATIEAIASFVGAVLLQSSKKYAEELAKIKE